MQETDGSEKKPNQPNCTFILAFSIAAFLYADISHKST